MVAMRIFQGESSPGKKEKRVHPLHNGCLPHVLKKNNETSAAGAK